MCADQNVIQCTIVAVTAVVSTLLYSTFDAFVCFAVHVTIPPLLLIELVLPIFLNTCISEIVVCN